MTRGRFSAAFEGCAVTPPDYRRATMQNLRDMTYRFLEHLFYYWFSIRVLLLKNSLRNLTRWINRRCISSHLQRSIHLALIDFS